MSNFVFASSNKSNTNREYIFAPENMRQKCITQCNHFNYILITLFQRIWYFSTIVPIPKPFNHNLSCISTLFHLNQSLFIFVLKLSNNETHTLIMKMSRILSSCPYN